MARFLAQRLSFTVIVLFTVSIVMFFALRLLPGGPLQAMLGESVSGEQIALMEERLGLDKPIPVQYALYMRNLVQGDLGRSIKSGTPVSTEIADRLPKSLLLAFVSVSLASLLGVVIGVVSALKQGTVVDYLAMLFAVFGRSVPEFWLALVLILTFAVKLDWLPAGGYGGVRHLILPCLTLAAGGMALIARLTRSAMLDVMTTDYVRTARAKGLAERPVIYRHMLKNALIPVVTVIGLVAGFSLGGSVLVETVFAWPGMGRLIVEAIFNRDYPVVQGAVLVYALTFSLVTLFVDILYGFLDARVRLG